MVGHTHSSSPAGHVVTGGPRSSPVASVDATAHANRLAPAVQEQGDPLGKQPPHVLASVANNERPLAVHLETSPGAVQPGLSQTSTRGVSQL